MLGVLKKLIKKLRKKSYPAYLSGQNEAVAVQSSFPNEVTYNTAWTNISSTGSTITGLYGQKDVVQEDKRIDKKPVEVVDLIIGEKPVIVTDQLDKQIKIVKRRIGILKEQKCNVRDEEMALGFLKARTKWKKLGEKFKWAITTNTLIEKLCKEYKVQKVSFVGYSRNVPHEALDEIEQFMDLWNRCRDDEPVLNLICDQGGKETRKDPILLASSPFGNWWYILGAWDREVEIIDDLVYNGK
jgi:hypothetical protein